jgi:SH3 domain protein
MKHKDRFLLIWLILFFIILTGLPVLAEQLYVKPSSEITMRRGQGTDFKIIAVIRDGTPVELLSTVDDWAQVRLESGREGWVLRRFLSEDPPLADQVELLEREKQVLSQTSQSLKQRLDSLTAEKDETEARLSGEKEQVEAERDACLAEKTAISDNFMQLQDDTADVIQTKNDLKSAELRIAQFEKQLSALEEQNRRLSKTETLKWFLAGGGVFLVGWIIGMISRRSRKKRSSLL